MESNVWLVARVMLRKPRVPQMNAPNTDADGTRQNISVALVHLSVRIVARGTSANVQHQTSNAGKT